MERELAMRARKVVAGVGVGTWVCTGVGAWGCSPGNRCTLLLTHLACIGRHDGRVDWLLLPSYVETNLLQMKRMRLIEKENNENLVGVE